MAVEEKRISNTMSRAGFLLKHLKQLLTGFALLSWDFSALVNMQIVCCIS